MKLLQAFKKWWKNAPEPHERAEVLRTRPINVSMDYALLKTWWTKQGYPIVARPILPKTGYMVYLGQTPLCAGFLYKTDSLVAWVEWIVVNPGVSARLRYRGLDLLIPTLTKEACVEGYKYVFGQTTYNGMGRLVKKHGWNAANAPVTQFFRSL